jgi:DNA-binding transcriptional LysR family regulator
VVRYVLERKADIGIFTNNVPYDGLTVQPYGEDEMVLIAALSHPLAKLTTVQLRGTLQYDFIAQHDSTSMNNVLAQAAAEAGFPVRLRSLMRSYDGVCRMVAADMGIGLVPASFAIPSDIFAKLHIVHLEDQWAKRQLLTGVRDVETLPAAVKVLRNHLS